MRYLLDTNIVSEVVRPQPSAKLHAWMQAQRRSNLFIATMTLAEIHQSLLRMPRGSKRSALESWFAGPSGPSQLFAGQILAFDEKAAPIWGRLMADSYHRGRRRDAIDMIIAATAERHHCVVATANESDFDGINIVNPLHDP